MQVKVIDSAKISFMRLILIGLIGNVVEWYDFAVYGFFSTVIGKVFFPSSDPAISLIASLGAFAAGFLVRPFGGLVFGRIGDLFGRSRAMFLSVLAMAVPTVLMAFLPTYEKVGIAAPIAIVLLRVVQGLSVGGEFTSSLVFLAEQAPEKRRAFFAVWGSWGATAGILLGSVMGLLVTNTLDEDAIIEWGWRIPFLIGGMVALSGVLVRKGLHINAPPVLKMEPVRAVFTQYYPDVLKVALLNIGSTVAYYTAFVYSVTYIRNIDQLGDNIAFQVNILSILALLFILPLAAWFSDRYGRRPVLLVAGTLLVVASIPLFHLVHSGSEGLVFVGEFGFSVIVGLMVGGLVATNVELIPTPVRCTGLAFAYNASNGIFGGTTPVIAAWLVSSTGNPIAPAYWVMAMATVSLFTMLFWVGETYRRPLN